MSASERRRPGPVGDRTWSDGPVTVHLGDAREVLRGLAPESVHCVVTSPPYWGLRDYGTAQWEGGADPTCDHRSPVWAQDPGDLERVGASNVRAANAAKALQRTEGVCRRCGAVRLEPTIWGGDPEHEHRWGRPVHVGDPNRGTQGTTLAGSPRTQALASRWRASSAYCSCGAWRGALGLEPTPQEYAAHLVEVLREVRRVLRPDGTCWLNLGDSYAAAGKSGGGPQGQAWADHGAGHVGPRGGSWRPPPAGLKPKDLVGIPWRIAFALQADGWWLRSSIVWSKPNGMPESVTDRPTASHEHVFLLARSERYFYDADAVREADVGSDHPRRVLEHPEPSGGVLPPHSGIRTAAGRNGAGRNMRSVWAIATQPYPEAHFATFPEELARRCIAAGTSEHGCCAACGAPWRRLTERTPMLVREGPGRAGARAAAVGAVTRTAVTGTMLVPPSSATTGWEPTCDHRLDRVPCIVLDPFAGSGTTLAVARRMGHRAIGIELQEDYLPLIQRRVGDAALPLLEMTAASPASPICDGCGRSEPIAYHNDNGRFCMECSAMALSFMELGDGE